MSELKNPSKKHAARKSGSLNGGEQHEYKFLNGYGASVIRSGMSYGGSQGLFELAVLDSEGHLTYDTPVTSDVLGYLDVEDLDAALDQIKALVGATK